MTEDEQEEMFRLRASNVRLRRENDYLLSRLTPNLIYWYMNGGVLKQNGSGIQPQMARSRLQRERDAEH